MTRIEVVTYDVETGCTQVDTGWDVPKRASRKIINIIRDLAKRVAAEYAREDVSTTHCVYVREV